MRMIGLTGGSGSGKSCVADELRRRSFPVFDADAEYHLLIAHDSPCVRALTEAFGTTILNHDGGIDTKKLAKIVFAEDSGRDDRIALLNRLTLHHVAERVHDFRDTCKREGAPLIFLDAPTLIESGLHRECDAVVFVTASKERRLARIMARDGIDVTAAKKRLDAQKGDDFYLAHAHYTIENNGDLDRLMSEVDKLCTELSKNA